MFTVPFERDFQKIAKMYSQQEKQAFSNRKKLASAKHKKSRICKNKLPQKFSATQFMPLKYVKVEDV